MKQIEFPVLNVRMIPMNKIKPNTYNPNNVAPPEMKLLKTSIEEDGYTQPIVVYYDKGQDLYIIVDGFHRYRCAKEYFNLKEIPATVIDKPIEHRMASTVRHNRARGEHKVEGMVNIVSEMVLLGMSDIDIGKNLGMSADEVLRLKQNSGIAALFKDKEFSKSWE